MTPQPSKLQVALSGPDRRTTNRGSDTKVGPIDAFDLARRTWLAGERVDMSSIARTLDVTRVTVYRWVGSREQLLVELIWSFTTKTIDGIESDLTSRGSERIVELMTRFLDATIHHPGMNSWLSAEGEQAMRLLTRYESGFQPRLVALIDSKLKEQVDAGELALPADSGEVAYVIEQLIESYVYRDIITGERPDAARAEPIFRMLLR